MSNLSRPILSACGMVLLAFSAFVGTSPVHAGELVRSAAASTPGSGTHPAAYGIGYDRYEPTFYTGFAPRASDPRRVHIHLGRGNQVRITAVLSDSDLDVYAADLLARYRTYRSLIDSGEIVLTQNRGFEEFESTVRKIGLEAQVARMDGLSLSERLNENLDLLTRLNPGRVFAIRMPIDDVIRRWAAKAGEAEVKGLKAGGKVDLVNAMLPTRLFVRSLDAQDRAALADLIASVKTDGGRLSDRTIADVRPKFVALLDRVSGGRYPLVGDALTFVEFTAVHPVGSFNEYTTYNGRSIPMYPTPGRRALTTHQRTKTPDHIPDNLAYSYSPWLPYMHVGSRLHNSFHTLWWQLQPQKASFLPTSARATNDVNRDGKPYRFQWVLSRGPMSHGCTHVNVGHINELRQIMPAKTKDLFDVEVFINKSHLYDVFDIDGDFEPEVMGVSYFLAYSLRNKRPHQLRVAAERSAYYDWLYGGELRFAPDGTAYFEGIRSAKFVGKAAKAGDSYGRIRLYEADYQPERVQFFAPKPIPFVRQLRKVGVNHDFSG